MHRLLHIKHWQFFLLMFVLPFIGQIILIGNVFYEMNHPGQSTVFSNYLIAYFLLCGLFGIFFFTWLWTLGTFLYTKLPAHLHMNIKRFKRNLIFPLIYIVFIIAPITFYNQINDQIALRPIILVIVVPLHLFCMYCMLYTLYFIAKTLTVIESKADATFGDYAGNFFLLWFWPIGVWFIQPKINALASDNNTTILQ